MNLAVQTVLLPGDDLAAQFDAARRFGFDAVEIVAGPAFDVVAQAAAVRRASEAANLPVAAICTHPTHDPLVPDP
ncbi:MAG: hypothetical protein IT337_14610, partial [Thermomicrobiales bacterium]|nr:hypothetical protein [Thermomicrobiales bacterium]